MLTNSNSVFRTSPKFNYIFSKRLFQSIEHFLILKKKNAFKNINDKIYFYIIQSSLIIKSKTIILAFHSHYSLEQRL